jgi:hypothetical protein
MRGLSLKISAVRRSTAQEISARGSARLKAAKAGKACTMSPTLPSLTNRILIVNRKT